MLPKNLRRLRRNMVRMPLWVQDPPAEQEMKQIMLCRNLCGRVSVPITWTIVPEYDMRHR